MFSFFKRQTENFTIIAPLSGKLIRLEQVQGSRFFFWHDGQGIAIMPETG